MKVEAANRQAADPLQRDVANAVRALAMDVGWNASRTPRRRLVIDPAEDSSRQPGRAADRVSRIATGGAFLRSPVPD